MAEYINREKLKTDFDDKAYYISHGQNNVERGMTLNGINQMIDEQQPENVVEREKIYNTIEEIKQEIQNGVIKIISGNEKLFSILENIGE